MLTWYVLVPMKIFILYKSFVTRKFIIRKSRNKNFQFYSITGVNTLATYTCSFLCIDSLACVNVHVV